MKIAGDRNWLHLEARYNYENIRTGSLWVGYNFGWGKTWQFAVTPMIGGVFGRTTGVAPGCEASLAWRKLTFSIDNEYVFDTGSKSGNFYYTWPQVTYQPTKWFKFGGVAQRTKEDQRYPEIKRCQLNAVAQDFPQPRKLAVAVAVQRGRNGGGGKRGRQQQ